MLFFPVFSLALADIAVWHNAGTDLIKVQGAYVRSFHLAQPSEWIDGILMINPDTFFLRFGWAGRLGPDGKTIVIRNQAGSTMVTMTIGGDTATTGDSEVSLNGVPRPYLKNGHVFIPLLFVMEKCGITVRQTGDEMVFLFPDTRRFIPSQRFDSSGLAALDECVDYLGYPGGLYPGYRNSPPDEYLGFGMTKAAGIKPLDEKGGESPDGKYALVSIGMSNTTMEFSTFKQIADANPAKNPGLVLVDGAIGGVTSTRMTGPDMPYWNDLKARLDAAGIAPPQVQILWIKQAIGQPTLGFPAYPLLLKSDIQKIIENALVFYPNIKLIYLSSRIYGGEATTPLNPEPYAYQSGFAVKWLIEDRIKSDDRTGPYTAWGPYIWANGNRPNSQGIFYEYPEDFAPDGTHPSPAGRMKVAKSLWDFFANDPTTKSWFLK